MSKVVVVFVVVMILAALLGPGSDDGDILDDL